MLNRVDSATIDPLRPHVVRNGPGRRPGIDQRQIPHARSQA